MGLGMVLGHYSYFCRSQWKKQLYWEFLKTVFWTVARFILLCGAYTYINIYTILELRSHELFLHFLCALDMATRPVEKNFTKLALTDICNSFPNTLFCFVANPKNKSQHFMGPISTHLNEIVACTLKIHQRRPK